ncbi:MAG: phosphodiester glycosidase family protein [Lachnospiraceae bacterium]|nr:phosphodiester glycosidase family protein [Lachnospiraceae bacterium]
MRRWIKKYGFETGYAIFLIVLTTVAVLDVFVIRHPYREGTAVTGVVTETPTEAITETAGEASPEVVTEVTAERSPEAANEAVSATKGNGIELSISRYCDTTVYVADVWIESPEMLMTAFAEDTYGRNIKAPVSDIAEQKDALFAINGDFYGARDRGYVIRNGEIYRTAGAGNEDLVIYKDGSFGIIQEDEISAEELLQNGAMHVFSFGPALLENGEITVSAGTEVGRAMASNPRTAIGMIEPLHYVMVVSDGRTRESEGLSLQELAYFMQGLGVQTAYNLDGGGSSTMVYEGEVVNKPTTGGNRIHERSVSDIVYIGK